MSEGNEEMVLIQDFKSPLSTTDSHSNKEEDTQSSFEEVTPAIHFSILSKPFYLAKYVIEETEDGFYIVNVRNHNRMFLTKSETILGGVIIVNKESDKKTFTIIKALTPSTVNSPSSRIIGTLRKEGLLMKFSAFDNSVKNITVNV